MTRPEPEPNLRSWSLHGTSGCPDKEGNRLKRTNEYGRNSQPPNLHPQKMPINNPLFAGRQLRLIPISLVCTISFGEWYKFICFWSTEGPRIEETDVHPFPERRHRRQWAEMIDRHDFMMRWLLW